MAPGDLHGVLVIDKPTGVTSAGVINRVKRLLRVKRVGHTGTLDPMATGVLPLCLGEGTKLASHLLAEDKRYEAELLFGVETDTLDAEGAVTAEDPAAARALAEADLVAAMKELSGEIEQVPPMFSALRQGGRRLHELARQGVEVERAPRSVCVHAFSLEAFEPPRARVRVHCSKGTYVRVLAADLGRRLGCGAHLSALRRTQSGRFSLADAMSLDELADSASGAAGRRVRAKRALIDPATALSDLRALWIPAARLEQVRNGLPLAVAELGFEEKGAVGLLRLLTPNGQLLAIAEVIGGHLRYARVFTYVLT